MPGWPNVGRTDDHRLLDALRRAETHAPASLYDAYADRLSDYAHSLLHDEESAARAVHDALVTALRSVHRLKEPVRFRAWLYAVTRFQCAARAGRTPPGGISPAAAPADSPDPELTTLVHEVLAELNRHEREVLDLAMRHDLAPAEVGTVLGLTSRQASARLARACDHLENSAAAVILARTGRAHCPDLSALVDSGVGASWRGGPLSTMLRRRLSRHISGCKVCTEGRHRHVSAGRLLETVPIVFAPLSLRRTVIDTCLDGTAAFAEQPFDRGGFPVLPERRPRRRRRRATPVAAATACAFLTAGALVLFTGQSPSGHVEAMNPPVAAPNLLVRDPTEEEPVFAPESDAPSSLSPSDSLSPSGSPSASASERATPSPVPSRTSLAARPTRRPARSATAKPTAPGTPALYASCPGDLGTAAGGVITLSARNAAITWTASTSGDIVLAPSRGRLRAGASGRIRLVINDPASAGRGVINFRSAAGDRSCRVSWDGRDDPSSGDSGPDSSNTPPPADPSESPAPASSTGPAAA